MRYHGQGHEIEIQLPDRALGAEDIPALRQAFEEEYSRQFSRAVPGMTIEILNWALEVSSRATCPVKPIRQPPAAQRVQPMGHRSHLVRRHGRMVQSGHP